MAVCKCGAELPPRRRVCDSCKALPLSERPTTAPTKKAPRKSTKKSRPKTTTTTPDPPAPPEPSALNDLHARGRALWTALGQPLNSAAGQLALEACRSADRLNELDSVIAGNGVLNLIQLQTDSDEWDDAGDHQIHVTVSFQSVLSEARQQQVTFKTLLAQLGVKGVVVQHAAPAEPGPSPDPAPQGSNPVDEVTRRRQQRR